MTSPIPPSLDPTPVHTKGKHIGRWILLALVIGAAGTGAWWYQRGAFVQNEVGGTLVAATFELDSAAVAPANTRIRVRVLNTTPKRGLARRATQFLREYGYDVVDYDTETGNPVAKTQIITHTGHADWSARVQRAIGFGEVVSRPDTSRLIDLTLYIGADWRTPPQPFRP